MPQDAGRPPPALGPRLRGPRQALARAPASCSARPPTKDFVALLGYEWHSSQLRRLLPDLPRGPARAVPARPRRTSCSTSPHARKALAIPHHVGYKQGWRGANFKFFRPGVSPVVEIFSEHGCTESDRAAVPDAAAQQRRPLDRQHHAAPARPRPALRLRRLQRQSRAAIPAPTARACVGVWATELTPRALFEAVPARRTYAATGDRIVLDVKLNGRPDGLGAARHAPTGRSMSASRGRTPSPWSSWSATAG